jgi:O-methyltransferase
MGATVPAPRRVAPDTKLDPTYRLVAREFAALEGFFRDTFVMLAFNGISGDYAEFGCCSGTTFRLAWRESSQAATVIAGWDGQPARDRHLWAFDSFAGLPPPEVPGDVHPRWTTGSLRIGLDEFQAVLAAEGIPRAAYDVVPGFYADTLVAASPTGARPGDVCFAYIDCNLYSSTTQVLRFMRPRLKHGMVIAFDDYYCYSSAQPSGQRQALGDVFPFEDGWSLVPYRPFSWHGMSFIVEATSGPAGIGHERARERAGT